MSADTETNSVVIRPPAVSGSYARSCSVSRRASVGISERISSACSSSISSSVSARSSGVISVTSAAAWRGVIASRNSVRSSSSRYSSTSAARAGPSAVRNVWQLLALEQLGDVGEVGRVDSSVSAAMSAGDSSSSARCRARAGSRPGGPRDFAAVASWSSPRLPSSRRRGPPSVLRAAPRLRARQHMQARVGGTTLNLR